MGRRPFDGRRKTRPRPRVESEASDLSGNVVQHEEIAAGHSIIPKQNHGECSDFPQNRDHLGGVEY